MRLMLNIFAVVMLPLFISACATSGGGAPAAPDNDGDGVPNSKDECAYSPKGAKVTDWGCVPDKDGDGVADSKDVCAYTPQGSKIDKFGCMFDKDVDGVADNKDVCAYTPFGSSIDAYGCMLDKDLDGVADNMDQCAKTPFGSKVDAKGCSKVSQALLIQAVEFEFDSARLVGFSQALLDASAIRLLKKHSNINVRVVGHTDATGEDAYNRTLSLKRAEAVREYMAANGIARSRMSVSGMGETRPIASNHTRAGREKNRRVMFIVVSN